MQTTASLRFSQLTLQPHWNCTNKTDNWHKMAGFFYLSLFIIFLHWETLNSLWWVYMVDETLDEIVNLTNIYKQLDYSVE